MTGDKTVSTKDIESLLVCIPGVQKARVVVNDWGAIKEIHILTGLDRSPKQIVRDVESALKAQWDINLDRRVVSVAPVSYTHLDVYKRQALGYHREKRTSC